MAFWTAGGSCSDPAKPAVSAAKPVSVLLHASGDFSTFVRLRVRVPATAASVCLLDTDADGEGCEAAANAAAAAVGRLHQLMLGLEQKSTDARKLSVTQIVSPELLQMMCQKVSPSVRACKVVAVFSQHFARKLLVDVRQNCTDTRIVDGSVLCNLAPTPTRSKSGRSRGGDALFASVLLQPVFINE